MTGFMKRATDMDTTRLNKVIDFMLERTDGLAGTNNDDDVAELVSGALNVDVIYHLQNYIEKSTTDNALMLSRMLLKALLDHAEDSNADSILEAP